MIPHIHNSPILKCDNTRYHKQIRLIIIIMATPHDPCASVCETSTGVEAQIFVRLPKFDAGLRAKCASLCATSRRIDVIFDDVGNHDG